MRKLNSLSAESHRPVEIVLNILPSNVLVDPLSGSPFDSGALTLRDELN